MASKWPAIDTLDHTGLGGVAFGTYLGGYLGVRFDSGTAWGTGRICTRVTDFSAGAPDAAVTAPGAGVEGKRYAFVRREEIAENGGVTSEVQVDATLFVRSTAPPASSIGIGRMIAGGYGVAARVRAGTLVEPSAGNFTPIVYLDQPNGYAAYVVGKLDTQVDVVIERWNAGTRTELSRTTITPIAPSFTVPFGVRLLVANSGSTVVLTVSLKNVAAREGNFGLDGIRFGDVPSWSSFSKSTTYTQVASVVDSSASRISSPGRGGFIADKENLYLTAQTQGHCRAWQASSAGTIFLRDEWNRTLQVGHSSTTRWGEVARNAACDWSYDRFGALFAACLGTPYNGGLPYLPASAFQGWPAERISALSAGVQFKQLASSPAQELIAIAPRETPHPRRARFRIDFSHPTGSDVADVHVGAVLRASQAGVAGFDGTTNDNFAGYVFRIDGQGRCSIVRRQYGANVLTPSAVDDTAELAFLDIAHTTSVRELVAEAVNENSPDPPDTAAVLLRMWIDGVQVVFTSSGEPGVSVLSDGTVRDGGQFRIPPSSAVGLYAAFPTTGAGVTREVRIHETELQAPTDEILPDSELASISFRSEASNASGVLVFTPSWTLPCEPAWEQVRNEFVTGNRHMRPAVTVTRDAWELGARAVDDDTVRYLEDFHDARGIEVAFSYTIPGRAAAKFVFAGPIEVEEHFGLFNVKFRLQQVHDA